MRIQTLSLVAGSNACNAKCPYCVSRMTGKTVPAISGGADIRVVCPRYNRRNLKKALTLAERSGTTTILITGKGEPMLDPEMIKSYLAEADQYNFPFVELQTNGLLIEDSNQLKAWYDLGLTTIAMSIVSSGAMENAEIFLGDRHRSFEYPDLATVTQTVHEAGLMMRLTCTMVRGLVDNWDSVDRLIRFCKATGVEQLALAPVRHPYESKDDGAKKWADEHAIPDEAIKDIKSGLYTHGHKLMTLVHGAVVVDVHGVSVCLRDCLTIEPDTNEIRQLIYYPSGRLMYDWQYKGAVLL